MKKLVLLLILLLSGKAMGQDFSMEIDGFCRGSLYINSSANIAAIEVRGLPWREKYKSVRVSFLPSIYIVQSIKTSKYGLVDRENKVVVPLKYEDLGTFECPSNIAFAKMNGKWGAITIKDEIAIPFEYDNFKVSYADRNPFCVQKNNKWGRVDEKGKVVTPFEYDDVMLTGYTTSFLKKDNKWGGTNDKSEMILPFTYDQVKVEYRIGVLLNKDNKWGMMNRDNQFIIPVIYDSITLLSKYWQSTIYCLVTKEGKKGVVDDNHKVIIPFDIYDNISGPSYNTFMITLHNKKGFFDHKGKVITSAIYEEAKDFDRTLAQVKRNGKWGCIDKEGKEVTPCQYDAMRTCDDLIAVRLKDYWGFLNLQGKLIVPCQYEEIRRFNGDAIGVKRNGKWGMINKQGKLVVPHKYDESYKLMNE